MAKGDNLNLRDAYDLYRKNVKKPVPYKRFKAIYLEFITRVVDNWILQGEEFNMKSKMGILQVIKRERNFTHASVNFYETNKLRKETGDNTLVVYYTDPIWFRFNWVKSRCFVPHKILWSFHPSRDNGTVNPPRGLRNKLSHLLKTDTVSSERFKFVTR